MPGSNPITLPTFPAGYLPRVHLNVAKGFDNVGVGNGFMPSTSAAAGSPQSPQRGTGFALRHGASIESLNEPNLFGQTHDPSGLGGGFGMGDAAGGDGPRRADYLRQIERSHPLDPGRQSRTYEGQHHQDVARELSALTQQWDQRAGAIDTLRTPIGAMPPGALFTTAQTEASSMSREHCTRQVLARLGVWSAEVEALLSRHAASAGGVAVIDACRLLAMPELADNPKANAKLEKQLQGYLDAAKGDYSGVYRAFGHDSHKQLKQLKACIDQTVDTVGRSVIKDRLLADSTPALVDALARKNPGMSSEALRGQLPDLINAQGFSALTHRMNNTDASGLLQDTTLLPQLVEAADKSTSPPAGKAAEPVNDFVKQLVSVLGAIKPPDIHIENNARQIVNQDGWNFQGNKDPRAATAVEAMPLPNVQRSALDDAESHATDECSDISDGLSNAGEDLGDEAEIEPQVGGGEQERQEPPRARIMGRGGALVNPLHGLLMRDLHQNSAFQRAADGGAHPLSATLVSGSSDVFDEDEDETVARSSHAGGAGSSDGISTLHRLKTPIPLGMHSSDLSGRPRE